LGATKSLKFHNSRLNRTTFLSFLLWQKQDFCEFQKVVLGRKVENKLRFILQYLLFAVSLQV